MKQILYYFLLLLFLRVGSQAKSQVVPGKPQTKSILIINGTAHLGDGGVIENSAAIGFRNGKISYIGTSPRVNKKDYDVVIDAEGKHIYPGFILPFNTLGLVEVQAVRATRDYAEVGVFKPNVRSLIAFDIESKVIPTIRSNGILVSQAVPKGGRIAGTSSVFNLDGWNWEDAVLRKDDGVHINWPALYVHKGWWANPGSIDKNKNYSKQVNELNNFMLQAKAYWKNPNPKFDVKLESMKGIFNGTKNLYVRANSAKQIMAMVKFCKDLHIPKPVLVGGAASYLVIDLLKDNNIPIILERIHKLPVYEDDDLHQWYKLPYLLNRSGILFCLSYAGDMEYMGSRNLPFLAGTATTYGLNKEVALSSISLNTAKVLGIDDEIGSLEVGKYATLFISEGDALDIIGNKVVKAYIEGREVDLNSHHKELSKKFRAKYSNKN